MKREYVTWKGPRRFAKWHLVDLPWRGISASVYTVCGKEAPFDCQISGPRRLKASDTCAVCIHRDTQERTR